MCDSILEEKLSTQTVPMKTVYKKPKQYERSERIEVLGMHRP